MQFENLFSFKDRNVLVTGASRGLGLEIAESFARSGAQVAISARSGAELEDAQRELETHGTHVLAVVNDLMRPDGPKELADAVMDQFGHIDVLVNNAGRGWAEPAEVMSPDILRKLMRLNVEAPFELSAEIARRCMIPRKTGRIINVTSGLGLRTRMPMADRPPMAAYAISKAAAVHMTRALAAEWGRYGITVNSIAPGPFPSRMNSTLADVEDAFLSRTPTGRLGRKGDLMGAALYLGSDCSAHTTGQILAIDGGMTLVM